MPISMKSAECLTPERIPEFLNGSAGLEFAGQSREQTYAWIQATLIEQQYWSLSKKERGAVRALLKKVSGPSMPHVTRLIRRQHQEGEIRVPEGRRCRFPVKYTERRADFVSKAG
jgi:hypothetical protein